MMRLYPPSLRTRRKVTGLHGGSNPLRRSINIPKVPGPDGKGSDCNSEALFNSSEFDSHRHLQLKQKDSYVAEQEVQHVCCKTVQTADRDHRC